MVSENNKKVWEKWMIFTLFIYRGTFMPKENNYVEIVKYRRHFRIYFRNNHPAYIVGEDGDMYIFHRVTHSKTSGGKKNWKIIPNPLVDLSGREMHIVRAEQKDIKGRFSPFELDTKKGIDISYPEIKRAGSTQTTSSRAEPQSSSNIKSKRKRNIKK